MQIEELYNIWLGCDRSFTTDTRKVDGGELFIALKGDRFNGNAYALDALKKGASFALVDEVHGDADERLIVVDDVLQTFQELARHHRRQFPIPVVAIAGSNGKTTTKELLVAALSTTLNVHYTKGNFNNHIGVPITLLEMPADTEVAIVEMGTNAFGEIAMLTAIVEPNHGVITNIGKEHLEGFGDLEGVAREESSLFDYLKKKGGHAFVNNSDPILRNMGRRLANKTTFGVSDSADYQFELKAEIPMVELQLGDYHYSTNLQGLHNAQNVACAVTIARFLGVDETHIQAGLSGYRSTNNRSQLIQRATNNILLDAYNANPSSMEVALETLGRVDTVRRVIILGDMFEMGSTSEAEHLAIAQKAFGIENAEVFLTGNAFAKACTELNKPGYDTFEDAAQAIQALNLSNAWILVKGSRGMKMERILDYLP